MKKFTTALELLSAASITTGAALAWAPLGFIVGGVLGIALAWATDPEEVKP